VAPTRMGGMKGLSRDVGCHDEPNLPSQRADEPTLADSVADRSRLGQPRFELAASGSGARFGRNLHRRVADQLRNDVSTRLEERQALDDARSAVSAGEGRRTIARGKPWGSPQLLQAALPCGISTWADVAGRPHNRSFVIVRCREGCRAPGSACKRSAWLVGRETRAAPAAPARHCRLNLRPRRHGASDRTSDPPRPGRRR
jgi:hypothetical protein